MIPLERILGELFRREDPPEVESYRHIIQGALETLAEEPEDIRPPDGDGKPGGLVLLNREIPTIVVPDLHARMDFFLSVLGYKPENGVRAIDLMERGELQIVCVGDGFHAEGRAARRWQAALKEYEDGYKRHRNMDNEMRESMGVMGMVMMVKQSFPNHFHFLKGNHENIANELGGGNYPFRKFAMEGHMVVDYVRRFYGEELLQEYALFEKQLPLLAVGRQFLISHAEPAAFFPRQYVIDYRRHPSVVAGLTWTDNDEAQDGSVSRMLSHYVDQEDCPCFHFGGHRPVTGSYRVRADGRYVQIHDPARFIIAYLPADREIDLDRDVREIEDVSYMAVEEYGE
jgi:hypothetical protein